MSAAEPAKEKLRQAIESLRADIDRVEFWADALDGLVQPIPDYQATDRLSQHLLAAAAAASQRQPLGAVNVCAAAAAINPFPSVLDFVARRGGVLCAPSCVATRGLCHEFLRQIKHGFEHFRHAKNYPVLDPCRP